MIRVRRVPQGLQPLAHKARRGDARGGSVGPAVDFTRWRGARRG